MDSSSYMLTDVVLSIHTHLLLCRARAGPVLLAALHAIVLLPCCLCGLEHYANAALWRYAIVESGVAPPDWPDLAMMALLADIPADVLKVTILPHLRGHDILNWMCTCREWHEKLSGIVDSCKGKQTPCDRRRAVWGY